ncbi:MAG: EamA family transporter [Bdellovibrionales bacterium]|nr:EamA family transporter [Bdellovibrionales bacterium]
MGSFLVILSAFCFATLAIFGKLAYQADLTRNQLLFYRFIVALPAMYLVLAAMKALPKDRRAFSRAILLGVLGIGIEANFYFLTLQEVGASLTAVFLYLYPAFVAIISHFFLKQRLGPAKWGCVALSLVGGVLTVDPFGQSLSTLGIIFGVLTGFWYGVYLVIGARMTENQNPIAVSTGVVTGATLVFGLLLGIDGVRGAPVLPPEGPAVWPIIAALAFLGSVIPFTTLYAGMKRVGAAQASVLSTLELVFTIVLAALFLGETLTPIQIAGSGLVLVSVLTIQHVK